MNIDNRKNDLVVVGQIVKTYGIKGQVKIVSYCQEPTSIFDYEPIFLESTKEKVKINFNNRINNSSKNQFLAKIASSNCVETSKMLVGKKLLASKQKFYKCEKNDFFYSDLEGCCVFNLKNELIGRVTGIYNFGAGDILEIIRDKNNSKILINFNKKNFPSVFIEEKKIISNFVDENW